MGAVVGSVEDPYDFMGVLSAGNLQSVDYTIFPSDSEHFIPHTILGISADTPFLDQAYQFVDTLLEMELNPWSETNRFPVSKTVFVQSFESEYDYFMESGISFDDPVTGEMVSVSLIFEFPTEDEIQRFYDVVDTLEAPALQNVIIQQIITDEGTAYLEGRRSLADTLSNIAGRLNLYAAEQE